MFDIRIDDDLLKLVEGKTVVVVGPAPHLIGTGYGRIIDSYDVVVRLNDIIPPPQFRKDYGSRTDILSHNFGREPCQELSKRKQRQKKEWKALKGLLAVGAIGSGREHRLWRQRWPATRLTGAYPAAASLNTGKIPLYAITIGDFRTLMEDMPHTAKFYPNIGTTTIQVLLSHLPSKLLVTGVSFYKNGTKGLRKDMYYPGHCTPRHNRMLFARERRSKGQARMGHKGPSSQIQATYFKEALMLNPVLRVDQQLAELLQLPEDRIVE